MEPNICLTQERVLLNMKLSVVTPPGTNEQPRYDAAQNYIIYRDKGQTCAIAPSRDTK